MVETLFAVVVLIVSYGPGWSAAHRRRNGLDNADICAIICSMKSPAQLITALKQCNCRRLAQLSGINIRTIYRIRDGQTSPMADTIERLEPHLKSARRTVVRANTVTEAA